MKTLLVVCLVALSAGTMQAQIYHPKAEMQWVDGPASFPGAKMVVLEGDPAKAGMFTMRIKFPAGAIAKPHFHSQTEHATVLSGVLHIGMGDTFDKAATKPLVAGSFGFWPAGMKHFAWMEGETILQLHGVGPWTITYVNPADDPRKPAK
jgi:quercetin dioxygenase-like cupin family protein